MRILITFIISYVTYVALNILTINADLQFTIISGIPIAACVAATAHKLSKKDRKENDGGNEING